MHGSYSAGSRYRNRSYAMGNFQLGLYASAYVLQLRYRRLCLDRSSESEGGHPVAAATSWPAPSSSLARKCLIAQALTCAEVILVTQHRNHYGPQGSHQLNAYDVWMWSNPCPRRLSGSSEFGEVCQRECFQSYYEYMEEYPRTVVTKRIIDAGSE